LFKIPAMGQWGCHRAQRGQRTYRHLGNSRVLRVDFGPRWQDPRVVPWRSQVTQATSTGPARPASPSREAEPSGESRSSAERRAARYRGPLGARRVARGAGATLTASDKYLRSHQPASARATTCSSCGEVREPDDSIAILVAAWITLVRSFIVSSWKAMRRAVSLVEPRQRRHPKQARRSPPVDPRGERAIVPRPGRSSAFHLAPPPVNRRRRARSQSLPLRPACMGRPQ
jgi:hypothetical protein